jgi:TonB family protein
MRTRNLLFLLKWILCIAFLLSGASTIFGQEEFNHELKTYINQKFILRSYGNLNKLTLKKTHSTWPAGGCDIAVEVIKAKFNINKIDFLLEKIGRTFAGGSFNCSSGWPPELTLTITELDDISPQGLDSAVQNILMTPEAYLSSIGRPFKSEQLTEAEAETKAIAGANGVTNPKVILQVLPLYTEAARKARIENKAIVSTTVGKDGKAHSPTIIINPGVGLGEQALRVLSLWRFEPGRLEDKSVDVLTHLEFSFKIY